MSLILSVALSLTSPVPTLAALQTAFTKADFWVVRPTRRAAVKQLFNAWIARDRSKFIALFVPRLMDGQEIASTRFKIFDDTDVFGDPILGAPDSQATIEDVRTFGNSELVTVFVRWKKPVRNDGRWLPLAYLYNVSFSKPDTEDGDRIISVEPVANYALVEFNG